MLLERELEAIGAEAFRTACEGFGVFTPTSGIAVGGDEPNPMVRPAADPAHGDFQFNGVLPLAKRLQQNPKELAQNVATVLTNHPAIAQVTVGGPGFVNVRLRETWVAERLTASLRDVARDGVPRVSDARRVVVDFSSPNIAKQMHVGHLRSTILGDALARVLGFVGHDVIRDNHIGDWGTQFGLLIVGMREWGDVDALGADPIPELERVYKLASQRAEGDEAFAESARAELAKLQRGDAQNRALWQQFVDASRQALNAVYAKLGVEFDLWLGESAYEDALPGVVKLLLDRGLAREDAGAICVFWNELADVAPKLAKQKSPFIVQKRDGAYLYSTTDIATAQHRARELHADKAVYVVDSRQSLHFEQLFAVMKLLGETIELEHVGFGAVLGDDNKPLRTRDASGQTITLLSLLDEATERAEARIREGVESGQLRVETSEIAQVARSVGIGAVKYADLRQNRLSDYQFDWEKMISFSGNAGPYLQYAYARCQSIFAKGATTLDVASNASIAIVTEEERALAMRLARFGDVLHESARTLQPHLVCEHLFQVAKTFSAFYAVCPVLDAEPAVRDARLALTALVARQLRRGLMLIGLQPVDRM